MTSQLATLSVAALLSESATRWPASTALSVGAEGVAYADLWAQTRAYAGALRDLGVGEGDTVAVLCPNVPDFARTYYAILSLGAIVVPIHALLKSSEIAFILGDSQAGLLVCAAPLLGEGALGAAAAGVPLVTVLAPEAGESPRLEDLAAVATPIDTYLPRAPEDTATILYTSGTTGTPKGAMGSHFALLEQTNVLALDTLGVRADDVVFGGLPLFHTFGQTVALNVAMRVGAHVVLLPKFEGTAALRTLIDARCTVMMGVPTMYIALLEAARAVEERPALRIAISGGASLPLAVMDRFRDAFEVEIYEGYGLTETSPVASFNHVGRAPRPGSIGTPIWGVDVEIADSETDDAVRLLPTGELGELVIRGHNLMKGYLNVPDETEKAVVDGWFRTGDIGRKDEEGYLWIVDRKKDLILRNGYNVYPREVEEVLAQHDRVSSVAVFGVPHDVHGQEVIACVIVTPGAAIAGDEFVAYAKERIASYKYPRRVEIVETLPLGPSGKVLKRVLTTTYTGSESAVTTHP